MNQYLNKNSKLLYNKLYYNYKIDEFYIIYSLYIFYLNDLNK